MKKSSTRITLLAMLVFASLCSYVFLNTVSAKAISSNPDATEETIEMETDQQQLIMPDVELLKKVVESGKRLLPAS